MRSVCRQTRLRGLVAAALATAMLAFAAANTVMGSDTFDVSGTVYSIDGDILTIVTSDLIGRPQPIMVDVSWLKGLQVRVGDPISLTIRSRESDTFLAIGLVRESPFVDGLDFGVREGLTVKQDSIEAGVGNVPEDDEALSKQHRDRNLRREKEERGPELPRSRRSP